jgi:hypothetical protein
MDFASSWLYATPNYSNSAFPTKSFQLLLKYHSGIPICDPNQRCLVCGAKLDVMGDHLIQCSSTGQRIGKHDALVRKMGEFLRKGKIAFVTELGVDKDRMGDIVLLDFQRGSNLYVDLSVTSTLCQSYRVQGSKKQGAAGEMRRQEKLKKYAIQAEQVAFEPLVVESLGGWNKQGQSLLKSIAARIATEGFTEEKSSLVNFMTGLSICLQQFNGAMMLERICVF